MSSQIPVACFAPPMTEEKLTQYTSLIDALPAGAVREAMSTLMACVKAWWALPESKRPVPADGRFTIRHQGRDVTYGATPLEEEHVKKLWDVTPWLHEMAGLSTPNDNGLFDSLPLGDLRNAAFHLLWHCREITLDREPITLDKLK